MYDWSGVVSESDFKLEMIAPALSLPNERTEWAVWLEQQLIGTELKKTIEQLVVLGGNNPAAISLEDWLGDDRSIVLERGLQEDFSQSRIESLVRNPTLLLELQELVLLEGGEYWLRVPMSRLQQDNADSVIKKMVSQIAQGLLPVTVQTNTRSNQDLISKQAGNSDKQIVRATATAEKGNRARWWISAYIVAAAAAITLFVFNPFALFQEDRFFAALELQSAVATPQLALERMAQRVQDDWVDGLQDPKALKQQLVSFRNSCDYLIDGSLVKSLDGLPNETISDVRQRCSNWKKKSSELIAAIDSGKAVVDIQRDADKMIETLTNKLREIAQG